MKKIIKDCIWELNGKGKSLTVKNIYDSANGEIPFNKLHEISEYLENMAKNSTSYNVTRCNGYLELVKIKPISIKKYLEDC